MKLDISKDRCISISHNDLDGCVSQIVVGAVTNRNNIKYYLTSFYEIDRVLKNLTFDDYDKVIITDIYPQKDLSVLDNPKILLLDHHCPAINNPEKNIIVDDSMCATKVVKKYMEEHTGINLSYLNDLVELTNDYDMWILSDPRSWELAELYFHYWGDKFRIRFRDGDLNWTETEKKYIKHRRQHLETLWNNLDIYKLDKINGCFIQSFDMINDLSHRLLNEKNFDFVFCRNLQTKAISVRTKPDNIHIGEILKKLGLGGGHKKAASLNPTIYEEIQKSMELVEETIAKELQNVCA